MMAFLPANRPLACVLLIMVRKEYQKRFRTPSSVLVQPLSRTGTEELISVYDSTDGGGTIDRDLRSRKIAKND
jgi:hypothetical protein